MAVGTVPASQPPRLRPSLWALFWECDTLPDAYLLLIVCCVCAFASLPFAEEVICKSLLSASLRGRDKLHERLWRLACLISFTDKLECTFVINTRSSLADSILHQSWRVPGCHKEWLVWFPLLFLSFFFFSFPWSFTLFFITIIWKYTQNKSARRSAGRRRMPKVFIKPYL